MNNADKRRLARLQKIITAVPFGEQFRSSTPTVGAFQYQSDMRQLRPAVNRVLEYILNDETEQADRGLDVIEKWIACRRSESWEENSHWRLGYNFEEVIDEQH